MLSCLFHVAGRGPAHQGLDRPRLLGLIIELPFLVLAIPDCIAFLAGLKMRAVMDGRPVRYATWKRVVETAGIV